jgi:hypothetical protein
MAVHDPRDGGEAVADDGLFGGRALEIPGGGEEPVGDGDVAFVAGAPAAVDDIEVGEDEVEVGRFAHGRARFLVLRWRWLTGLSYCKRGGGSTESAN